MDNESGKTCKGAIVAQSTYCTAVFMEELRRTMSTFYPLVIGNLTSAVSSFEPLFPGRSAPRLFTIPTELSHLMMRSKSTSQLST
jgi:hypothetical protein